MELLELRLSDVRNVAEAVVCPGPGISEFVGSNGAGKTSLLEAVFMLSHGRSFRSVKRESLIRFGAESLEVFARVRTRTGERRLGLSRRRGDWSARVDGADVAALSELLREIAVICFEPGSHNLVSGGAEERRHFVDWALFHVEPEYLAISRRYRRALQQRNVLLRQGGSKETLDAWDAELVRSGEQLDSWRKSYLDRLAPALAELAGRLVPMLGEPELRYQRGWSAELGLAEALHARRERDHERGHTSCGPHRADWRIGFPSAPEREHLSRGQEKLCALVCLLGQATLFKKEIGEWPLLCLDDLASELDLEHQRGVLNWLDGIDAQVLVTGTVALPSSDKRRRGHVLFHVEQGTVTALL